MDRVLVNPRAEKLVVSIERLKTKLVVLQRKCKHPHLQETDENQIDIHRFCPDCGFEEVSKDL